MAIPQEQPITMMIPTVSDCARCGGVHKQVGARMMARPFSPPEAGGIVWSHWFACPTNGDPVLVSLMPRPKAERHMLVRDTDGDLEGMRGDGPNIEDGD